MTFLIYNLLLNLNKKVKQFTIQAIPKVVYKLINNYTKKHRFK